MEYQIDKNTFYGKMTDNDIVTDGAPEGKYFEDEEHIRYQRKDGKGVLIRFAVEKEFDLQEDVQAVGHPSLPKFALEVSLLNPDKEVKFRKEIECPYDAQNKKYIDDLNLFLNSPIAFDEKDQKELGEHYQSVRESVEKARQTIIKQGRESYQIAVMDDIYNFVMVDGDKQVGNMVVAVYQGKKSPRGQEQIYPDSWFMDEKSEQLKPVLEISGFATADNAGLGYGRAGLQRAYEMSLQQGCEGRVTVPSTWGAGPFYEHCGFSDGLHGIKYFEPTEENIAALYKGEKKEGLRLEVEENQSISLEEAEAIIAAENGEVISQFYEKDSKAKNANDIKKEHPRDLKEADVEKSGEPKKATMWNMLQRYWQKYFGPRVVLAAAVLGTAAAFPPAIPAVIAVGTAVAYVEYKKKNPKATFKHFVKSGFKKQRNQILLGMQNTEYGQTIMQTKKRLEQRKRGLKKGEVLQEVEQPYEHLFKRSRMAQALGIKPSPLVLSDNAQKAKRLNHIRWINIKKGMEK